MNAYRLLPLGAILVAACGGGDAPVPEADFPGSGAPAEASSASSASDTQAPSGGLSLPDWYVVDHDARTVTLSITAGTSPDNNYWNFNGFVRGQIGIVVPEGYAVNVDFTNRDPNMAHSLGISAEVSNFMTPPTPNPVFDGAITENPQSMIDATMPGETERISFVAERAGSYSLVCFIPGHSAVGMWIFFDVSAEGEAGVRGL